MADKCLFCEIVAGDIPATLVHQSDGAVAFADVAPKAPTHVLVIPRTHLSDIGELAADHEASAAVLAAIAAVARKLQLESYRTVFNTGPGAGQTVFHVHAHILAGRDLTWPPG